MMKKMQKSGFTLMELMIVIAIIAIFTSIAIPNFLSWLPEKRLADGAQDILMGLQKSRSRAIMTNRDVIFNFDADSFAAFVDEDDNGGQDAGEQVIVNRDLPPAVDITTSLLGDVTTITFDNRGIPDTSGRLILQNNNGTTQDVRLYLSGHSVLE
jgi:type II secretion system protein H